MRFLKTLAVAIVASSAFAGTIAVLDSKEIITNSAAYKSIAALPDTKYKTEREKVEKLRADYTSAMNKLTQEKLTSKDADFKAREQAIEKQRAELEKEQRALSKTIAADQNAKMKTLLEKFQTTVDNFAKSNKFELVINKYAVISTTSEKLDITDKIANLFAKIKV